jgi:LPXTG-site transpeptidase (sortase) family protein
MGKDATRLVIPSVNMDLKVKDASWTTVKQQGTLYSDWVIPFDAVGHLITTPKPGEQGNIVISGHHNLIGPNKYGKGLFAGLWDIKETDSLYLFDSANRVFEYRVTRSFPLKEGGEQIATREQHARDILADDGKPHLTLITCWNGAAAPLSGNTYRWIVQSELVGPFDPAQVPTPTPSKTPHK